MARTVKVVLLQDIQNIGIRSQVKTVRFGFAKNWLIPQKLATLATPALVAQAKAKQEKTKEQKGKAKSQFSALLEKLGGTLITMRPKKTAKGTLYAAIDAEKISQALKRKQMDVNPKYITIEQEIKKVGEYEIPVVFDKETKGTLKLRIQ